MTRIAVVPRVSGVGGMVSFRERFTAGLQDRGIEVINDLRREDLDAVLVIGGMRDLPGLWQARRRGARIVQRLNGMNWLHRRLKTGWRHALKAEYGNYVLQIIRSRLADHVVYQSEFAQDWWEREWGPAPGSSSVVYNAVDLNIYKPGINAGGETTPQDEDCYRVLLVEGSLMGGYEQGLETAVGLVERLNDAHSHILGRSVGLVVAGRVPDNTRRQWQEKVDFPLTWVGLVQPEEIIRLDQRAHILYSADLNPACPNAVIEALACGLPVLAFSTGAIPELVRDGAGEVVPYGANPWRLEPPDLRSLAESAVKILTNQRVYHLAARKRAQAVFELDAMVDGYLEALTA